MSDIKELLENEIYPAIFEKADTVFTEHDFKSYQWGWGSKTYLEGTEHADRKDKTVIRKKAIGYITEWGGESVSIWDYVMNRDSLDKHQTITKLAQMAGINLPNNLSPEELERIREANKAAQIWEDANTFFINCLSDDSKDSQGDLINPFVENARAQNLRTYITKVRGYTAYDLRLYGAKVDNDNPKMELGFIPSLPALVEHLTKVKGHSVNDVNSVIKVAKEVGESHVLTIPYRTPSGKITGFMFRNTASDGDKWRYSVGIRNDEILFNLTAKRGRKDIVIVESQLDALIATARGIKDVTALGGKTLYDKQIREALRCGAKKITLALDNDQPGTEATMKAIEALRDYDVPVYVALYPEGIKDADELIRKHGVEEFQGVISTAISYYRYALNETLLKYQALQDELNVDILPDKLKNDLLQEVTKLASLLNPVHKDLFIKEFLTTPGIPDLGISQESITAKADELRYDQEQEKKGKELARLMADADKLRNKGQVNEAFEILLTRGREIAIKHDESDFSALIQPITEDELRDAFHNEPDSLQTSYQLFDHLNTRENLTLPAGALTIVAARTSHRKTGLMLNLLRDLTVRYKTGKFHFFSYEEASKEIHVKFLNILIDQSFNPDCKNLKYIKGFYKTGGSYYNNNALIGGKQRYFDELISTGRVKISYSCFAADKLCNAIRYIKEKEDTTAIFIDYLQLLKKEGSYGTRQLELQATCETLRETAIETGLPLILGAQFNREVKQEGDIDSGKIREAGDIEQTANLIIGLWDRAFTKEGHKDRKGNNAVYAPGELYAEILKGRDVGVGANAVYSYTGNTGRILPEAPTWPAISDYKANTNGKIGKK